MLKLQLARKRSRFVRDAFQRRCVPNDTEDDYETTIIIGKSVRYNILYEAHESIFNLIQKDLPWQDLISLKTACALANKLVSHADVVDRMIQGMDMMNTFCACIHNNNATYVKTLIDNYSIPRYQLIRGLIYCLFTLRNDTSRVFLDALDFPRYSKFDTYEYLADHCVYCETIYCLFDYINAPLHNECGVSQKMLLQMTCAVDNIVMFRHILGMYDVGISHIELWISSINCSTRVFKLILNDNPNQRISQRMLIRFVRFQGFAVADKIGFLHYVFARGLAHLSRRLNNSIIDYCRHINLSRAAIRDAAMLVETYGSHRMVQSTMTQYIQDCMPTSIEEMADVSKRLIYKQKHIDMITTNMDFWSRFPKIEYILVNKLKLQERKQLC